MRIQKAINELVDYVAENDKLTISFETVTMAIAALEKQMPYKPKEYEDKYYSCKCGNVVLMKYKKYPTELMPKKFGLDFCLCCGQKIDWSEVEEC